MQVSSPPKNSLKTELLTYSSFSLRTSLCSVPTAPQKSNNGWIVRNEYFTEHDGYAYRIITNDEWKCVNLITLSVF